MGPIIGVTQPTNESKLTRKLLDQLKRQYPLDYVCKLSDRFTVGVPDMVVVRKGMTIWIEVKQFVANPVAPVFHLDRNPQFVTMQKLGSQGCGLYVIYFRGKVPGRRMDTWLSVWQPDTVLKHISGRFSIDIPYCDSLEVVEVLEQHGKVIVGTHSAPAGLFTILEDRFSKFDWR